MNFVIPRNNELELLLYIWKIIDLPRISEDDLLYMISFELFLLPPKKAKNLIESGYEKKYLLKNEDITISLSENLNAKLKKWNELRKKQVIINLKKKAETIKKRETTSKSDFGLLIKALTDMGSLNRAVSISDDAIEITEIDLESGTIKAHISGTKDKPYKIEIDPDNLILSHDCHDFVTRKSKEKKFCKHLIKLFLILKEKNQDLVIQFLDDMTRNINKWEFIE